MRAEKIREICIKAADDMLAYSRIFGASDSVVKVRGYTITPSGQIHMKLDSRIGDTSGMFLRVGDDVFSQDCFVFIYSDPRLKTAGIKFVQGRIETIFAGKPDLELISDMSFLLRSAREYFDAYGDMIGYPSVSPSFGESDYRFPEGTVPSDNQREAVRTILNSPMSYIWGAPGTGKTQMVLSTAIMAYMSKGARVAVVAPTNNALEQVIHGVVSAIRSDPGYSAAIDPEREIARVGTPTPSFLKSHPGMCERKAVEQAALSGRMDRDAVADVIDGRLLERAKPSIIRYLAHLKNGGSAMDSGDVSEALAELEGNTGLGDLVDSLVFGDIDGIEHNIDTARYDDLLEHYSGCSDDELRDILESTAEVTCAPSDPGTSRIVACTPQTFMSRFSPNGVSGSRNEFAVDHIFIDEAGYCSCLLALALLANRVPVTLLGDHKQLPPVCAVDDETLRGFIAREGFMRYGFLMSQSALFIESMLTETVNRVTDMFVSTADPVFTRTKRTDLTESHRFGPNLGTILDRYVYHNGVTGFGRIPLEIVCIDVACEPRDKRCNVPEAEAVRNYLESEHPEDFCILSPYRTQIDTIRKIVPEADERLMTVHKSQGREWDTVILSVQDGTGCNRDVPLRFTSSLTDTGLKVINTAVSRAKRRLVIVCDYAFWHIRSEELIGVLVSSPECRFMSFVEGDDGAVQSKTVNNAIGSLVAGDCIGNQQEAEHRKEARPRCRERRPREEGCSRRLLRCRETQAHGSPRQAESQQEVNILGPIGPFFIHLCQLFP